MGENLQNIPARPPPEHPCFLVSAETGEGVDALLAAIEDRLAATRMTLDLSIDAADGAGISWLHRNSEVLNKELHDGRFDMTVRVDETKRDIVVNRFEAVSHAGLASCSIGISNIFIDPERPLLCEEPSSLRSKQSPGAEARSEQER